MEFITLVICAEGGLGHELFYATVCSPKWLRREKGDDNAIFGRGYIIMFDWDYERLLNMINYRFSHMNRDSWDDLAAMLQKDLGLSWEFDNYDAYDKEI